MWDWRAALWLAARLYTVTLLAFDTGRAVDLGMMGLAKTLGVMCALCVITLFFDIRQHRRAADNERTRLRWLEGRAP